MIIWMHDIICGISLKFPRWFIKWFVDFGPVPTIFPKEINEAYNYFGEKLSSNILCSFTSYNLDNGVGIHYHITI
ncbi:hypothetical protein CR513_30253, partial [Mucuna pruriens]